MEMDIKAGENKKYHYTNEDYIAYSVFWHWPKILVFLHWLWASSKSRYDLIQYYKPDEYTTYLIDLKWYWYSSKPRDNKYSIAHQGDILDDWMESLDLQNVTVVGHSLGGGTAMYMYRMWIKNDAARISKMILISTMAYKWELPILYWLLANRYTMRFIYTFSVSHFKAKYTLLWACKNWKPINEHMIARYAEFLKWDDFKYVIMKSCQQLIWKDYEDTIKAYESINIPVLIIWWKNDPIMPSRHAEKLAEVIPNSNMITFPKCGHIPHEEETLKTFTVMDEWLNA